MALPFLFFLAVTVIPAGALHGQSASQAGWATVAGDTLSRNLTILDGTVQTGTGPTALPGSLGVETVRGLFFSVQLAVVQIESSTRPGEGLGTLLTDSLGSSRVRYLAGVFRSEAAADSLRRLAANAGYSDAFTVAYLEGEQIKVEEARRLLRHRGTKVVAAEELPAPGGPAVAKNSPADRFLLERISVLDTVWLASETAHSLSPTLRSAVFGRDVPESTTPADSAVVHSSDSDDPFTVYMDTLRQSGAHHTFEGLQIRVDPRERTPMLNVTAPGSAVLGEEVVFHAYTNYPDWITRYELRILRARGPVSQQPLAVLTATDANGTRFRWAARVEEGHEVVRYVLRVYGEYGTFDETAPRSLPIITPDQVRSVRSSDEEMARAGYGQNSREVANIPVSGAAVTVFADSLDPETKVFVRGRPVPVSRTGRFASRTLLTSGTHTLSVEMVRPDGSRSAYSREITIPGRPWFYMGLADVTVGSNSVDGPASLVTGQQTARYRGEEYVDGRLAFYLKGGLGAETVLTASADTWEQPFSELFTNFGARDPRSLLRRLDINEAYPVYGDDGTLVDDAPSQGKFHLRLERHDSHLMWGSFRTPVVGTDLVHFNRGLYGAELQHQGLAATEYGERKTTVNAFAADPGTAGSREEFRATGGSLYYLHHRDILGGSERVQVEVRDRESDLVLERTTLTPYEDYEVNALQGRILLQRPLSMVAEDKGLVRTGALSGNPVYLVVSYEFYPGLTRLDNFTTGGRVSQWLGDHLQLGITGYRQEGREVEQDLVGGDLTLRYRPGTYLKVEGAFSEGRGSPVISSMDGGFSFATKPTSATAGMDATAQRAELSADFTDFGEGNGAGGFNAYVQRRGDGYSAPGQLNTEEVRQGGLQAEIPVGDRVTFTGKADLREGDRSGTMQVAEGGAELGIGRHFRLKGGVRYDQRETGLNGGNSDLLSETGARTDAVGVFGFWPEDSAGISRGYHLYTLYQGTLDKDQTRRSNDRYGIGAGVNLWDRLDLSAEATEGDGGWGGKAEAGYQLNRRLNLYLNYVMDPDRTDFGPSGGTPQSGLGLSGATGRTGIFATGARYRYNDNGNVFVERRQQSAEAGPSGVTHAFGIDLAPWEAWSVGLQLERGTVSNPTFGDVDRTSASLFSAYSAPDFRWNGALEYRTEDGSQAGSRDSWLIRNSVGLQLTPSLRMLGRANLALSDISGGGLGNAEYTELVGGLAYRPVRHNRFNALARYTYLHDVSSPVQLGTSLQLNPFAQRSHVVSVDGIYRLFHFLSIGGKVGYRRGEIRDRTLEDAAWTDNTTWLYIARADLHVVKRWDLVGEYRTLTVEQTDDTRSGVLLGLYRQITGNLRLGAGYNFTDYSDDLTDLSYRSRGWFINVLGVL
ncbi:MAG: hypothetical protein U5K31_12350 [Balneolaceae bacterium]|nr:hypothetical protein [Balneolaceae bacterium]